MMKQYPLLLAVIAIILFSCHKPKSTPVKTGMVLANRNDTALFVDIYHTRSDLSGRSNCIYSTFIPTRHCVSLPEGTLKLGTTYYCNVHSADYNYCNWADTFAQRLVTAPVAMADTISIGCNYTPQMNIFLGAANTETRWRAVDRYSWSISVWNMLSETEKYRQVTIHRDLTCEVRAKDENDNIVTTGTYTLETFITPGTGIAGLILKQASGTGYQQKMINSPVSLVNNPGNRVSADTVIFEDNLGYWAMVRE